MLGMLCPMPQLCVLLLLVVDYGAGSYSRHDPVTIPVDTHDSNAH